MHRFAMLFKQLARFGIVGLTAASVHFGIVTALVQYLQMQPLIANIFGFCIAFQVSYWGHRKWTFHGTTTLHAEALTRLLLLQTCALIANEALFFVFLQMHIPYQLALLIVLTILPIFTFVFSKFWVFV